MSAQSASERHPAHEGAEHDTDGRGRRSHGEQKKSRPRELENERRESADKECQEKQSAPLRHDRS